MINVNKGYDEKDCNESKVNETLKAKSKLEIDKCGKKSANEFNQWITQRYRRLTIAAFSLKPKVT